MNKKPKTKKFRFWADANIPVDFIEALKNGEEDALKYDRKIKNELKKAIDQIDFREHNIYSDVRRKKQLGNFHRDASGEGYVNIKKGLILGYINYERRN